MEASSRSQSPVSMPQPDEEGGGEADLGRAGAHQAEDQEQNEAVAQAEEGPSPPNRASRPVNSSAANSSSAFRSLPPSSAASQVPDDGFPSSASGPSFSLPALLPLASSSRASSSEASYPWSLAAAGPSGLRPPPRSASMPSSPGQGPRRGVKRSYPGSPAAASPRPSSSQRPSGLRTVEEVNAAFPIAAVASPATPVSSSEAAAFRSRSAVGSPLYAPPTPASDSFMISSSTGLVSDSMPATPEVAHGDSEISMSSPAPRHLRRMMTNDYDDNGDDAIDSTVDSNLMPLTRSSYRREATEGEVCHSSRCLDSSDEDDGLDRHDHDVSEADSRDISCSHLKSYNSADGISTSGQVDEGQFRLVPNREEDDVFNQRQRVQAQVHTREEPEPTPGTSRDAMESLRRTHGSADRAHVLEYAQPQQQPVADACPLPQNSRPSVAVEVAPRQGLEEYLPCSDDLQLSRFGNALDVMEVASSFGQPVDLEDIQVQKLVPEHSSSRQSDLCFMPDLPDEHLQEAKDASSTAASQDVGGLSLGHAFSGLPASVAEVVQTEQSHCPPADASGMSTQHSSILESMTGPLSKRLRTLHSIQLQQQEGMQTQHAHAPASHESESANANAVPSVSHGPSVLVQDSPEFQVEEHRASISKGNEDSFLGGVQQTFSVTSIETFGMIEALKQRPTLSLKSQSEVDSYDGSGDICISDNPVASRARASLPSSHLGLRKVGPRLGVFAKRRIPVACRFGPLEGKLVLLKEKRPQCTSGMRFVVTLDDQEKLVDVSDEESSNWMRFVDGASRAQEQNLSVIEDNGRIFFVATRAINQKEELKVGYSAVYAKKYGLEWLSAMAPEADDHSFPLEEESSLSSQSVLNAPGEGEARPPKTRFQCSICPRSFNRPHSLNRHLGLHRAEKIFACADCNAKFAQRETLESHRQREHRPDPGQARPAACPVCGLTFASDAVYKIHLSSHHSEEEQHSGRGVLEDMQLAAQNVRDDMTFECPECSSHFDTWAELVEHVGGHGASAASSAPAAAEGSSNANSEPEQQSARAGAAQRKLHKCELCYKSFAEEERLKRHMSVHGSEDLKPLPCHVCGKRYISNSALVCHMKIHSEEKSSYDCPICGQLFAQIVNLKLHVHCHRVKGKYSCPHCPKVFSAYSFIRKHIRAFHGEKRFSCPECNKTFVNADKLKLHLVIHSDVKDFLCSHCGKGFRRKDKLREHVQRMHARDNIKAAAKKEVAKEKFVPNVSPTDFHRFIYKCKECLVGFKRRGMLVNHLAKRHPEVEPDSIPELSLPILKATKHYFCQYCTKVYRSSSKRKTHIIKAHPGARLPASVRDKAGVENEVDKNTFSATIGSVTTMPHRCSYCHKQYASNAKLLQHKRKKHREKASDQIVLNCNNNVKSGELIDETEGTEEESSKTPLNPQAYLYSGSSSMSMWSSDLDPVPVAFPEQRPSTSESSLQDSKPGGFLTVDSSQLGIGARDEQKEK